MRLLFLASFLLLFVFAIVYRERVPGAVTIVEGTDVLQAETVNIGKRSVKSCVWYVDDQEKLRSDRLCNYRPASGDSEKFIRLEVTLKDGGVCEDSLFYSVLPVLYLDGETAYEDVDKTADVPVTAVLEGRGYTPEELYEGGATIHLRGNSTASLPKKPFKLRLDEKKGLLGMSGSRHWILLANAIDASLMRNQLAYELSASLGASCSIDSRQVTLIYNGEYCGVYQLCEQVRVEDGRVDVYNWDKTAAEAAGKMAADFVNRGWIAEEDQGEVQELLERELLENLDWLDTGVFSAGALALWEREHGLDFPTEFQMAEYVKMEELPDPTGGVLLEMDGWDSDRPLTTAYHMPFYFVSPREGETFPSLYASIKESLQALEYAFHSTDFVYHEAEPHYEVEDEGTCNFEHDFQREDVVYRETDFQADQYDGCHYSDLMDMDSLLVNFLMCEFTMNWDAMKHSVFVYKDVKGPYYIDLAWDYDWAWGNSMFDVDTWIWDDWQTTNDYYTYETYYQSVQWNRYLIRDPYFLMLLWEKYQEVRGSVLEELVQDGGTIDQYAEQLRPAAEANDARWGGCQGTYEGQTFAEGVEQLKRFMKLRLSWMDEQFASVESLRKSFGYYANSSLTWISEVDQTSERGKVRIVVETEVPECTEVSLQVNGTSFYTESLLDGKAVFEVPNAALRSGGNVAQARLRGADGTWLVNPDGTTAGDYTNAISNYAYFVKKR